MKILLVSLCSLLLTFGANASTPLTELIVKVKPGQSFPAISGSGKVQNLFGNIYILRGSDLRAVEVQLKNHSSVEYTQRNSRAEKTVLPSPEKAVGLKDSNFSAGEFNDPLASKVWSFKDASSNGISVEAAYRINSSSNTQEIIVAVVDTGVDSMHEDLKDVMWINELEIPANGIDDDQNGYVDDIHGINTLVRDTQGRATGDIRDTHSHGTHVSGTIGAKQNNSKGIAGIASNVKIMGIRTVPNNGDETDIDVAESFIYAAKNGAKIINCSFGKSSNEGNNLIPETLKYIQETYGVLVIAAAGNNSSNIDRKPTYPASHSSENLLIVASTNSTGGMSYFSNYGILSVDVAAPGSSIYSTTPGNRYESMSGTSMASPTTAGLAAEILSHNPHLTPLQLKEVIMKSVTKSDRFKDKMISGGRIDLLKGLELAKTIR
jgi:thermitase